MSVRRPDPDQARAIAVRRNAVVSAGAGSGKTTVLSLRYLSLIIDDRMGVDEILCMTFTRKAAAEMYTRIHGRLQAAAADPHLDASARAHVAAELARFDDAEIGTLDSFCARILQDAAARFGLPAQVSVDPEAVQRESERAALSFALANDDDPMLAALIRANGLGRTIESLLSPILSRVVSLAHPVDFAATADRIAEWLTAQRDTLAAEITATVEAILALDTETKPEFLQALAAAAGDFDRISDAVEKVKMTGSVAPELKELVGTLAVKGKGMPRPGLLTDHRLVRDALARHDDLAGFYARLATLQDEHLAARRRSGRLQYHEIMELAVRALAEDVDLRRSYTRRFRALMIDEFQDNNATQRDLLYLLAERPDRTDSGVPVPEDLAPDRLFFVGDQKQSIYRFRGADVSVFRHLSAELTRTGGHALSLPTNYRSSRRLIRLFNEMFPRVFAVDDIRAEEDFFADFEPLLAPAPTAAPDGDATAAPAPAPDTTQDEGPSPAITVGWVNADEEDDAPAASDLAKGPESEAAWVVEEIERLIAGARPGARRYRPGEIAILFRATGNQRHYERSLRRRGIPYESQTIRSLFLEAPAADVAALLTLIWEPDDPATRAAIYRSPLVNLSDSGLYAMLGEHPATEPFGPTDGVGADDRERLAVAGALYGRLCALVDRVAPAELVRMIRDEGGYRYALLRSAQDHPYLQHFDYLMSMARAWATRPTREFARHLMQQLGAADRTDSLERPASDAVQLMTIHGAKGLEFPVVFAVDLAAVPKGDSSLYLRHPDLGLAISMPPLHPGESGTNPVSRLVKANAERQEDAEMRRLLYVACTRAEELLYLTGAAAPGKGAPTLLRRVVAAFGEDGERVPEQTGGDLAWVAIPPRTRAELRSGSVRPYRRPTAEAVAHLNAIPVVERAAGLPAATPSGINAAWRAATHRDDGAALDARAGGADDAAGWDETEDEIGADAGALGTLTHRIIEERLRAEREGAPERSAALLADAMAPIAALDRTEREAVVSEAQRLADSFFQGDIWSRVAGHDPEPEVPFVMVVETPSGPLTVTGTMDLVCDLGQTVLVVDYKTDRVADPGGYAAQMALYREAAIRLYRKPAAVHLVFLRSGESFVSELPLADVVTTLYGS